MRVLLVMGTRPEIIKFSPVYRELVKRGHWVKIYHTNQNFTFDLSVGLIKEMGYSRKDVIFHPATTAYTVIKKICHRIALYQPNFILVQGDTWAVLQGTLAGLTTQIPVGHVEAGLRSFDPRMVEEKIRIMADSTANLLFAPTPIACENIRKELGRDSIITGNPIYDLLKGQHREEPAGYILATLHRPETVDNPKTLDLTLAGIRAAAGKRNLKIRFLAHPRTQEKLRGSDVTYEKPTGYFNFINLLKQANLVMTDSGGVQEEAAILKVPCVTLRDNTERQETVINGLNVLGGHDPKKIEKAAAEVLEIFRKQTYDHSLLYGDGTAGKQIVDILESNLWRD